MALRNIRKFDDDILRKKSRIINEIDDRIITLIKDMQETMYDAQGVGLAAPQVGVLKKIFVIDIYDGTGIKVFINPEILETSGEVIDIEGCLSLPGEQDEVKRPQKVKVKATNINGEEFVLEADGLLARAVCHENDHLYGVLFKDYVEK